MGMEIFETFTGTQTRMELFNKTCDSVSLGPLFKRVNTTFTTILQSLPTPIVYVLTHQTTTYRREQWITNLILVHTVCVTLSRLSVALTDLGILLDNLFIDCRLFTCHLFKESVVMVFVISLKV